jgi:peroxiredoxin
MAGRLSFSLLVLAASGWYPSAVYAQEKAASKTAEAPVEAKDPVKAKVANAEPTDAEKTDAEVLAGHSNHGEAFNAGPRQKAYLMQGTGNIQFPVTSKHPEVQKFVEQGIGQQHGYWYFEAERSFRQAAMLDPDCAIAYWGMAMANRNNKKRSAGFMAKAVERKAKASPREVLYIDALAAYLKEKNGKKRTQAIYKAYQQIVEKFPEDLEAKARLAYTMYRGRSSLGKSYEDVDKALRDVLAINPMHPVHHYRVHLWDHKDPSKALDASALCGQASPSIAHMWHMPGHIYSRLKRYQDAVWQQEASARVDHAQMMRDWVMPDQISNFAHNNEWLIRNLAYVGRWQDAVDLSKNMIELPRHPKYNTLKRRGSAYYGRLRLFDTLYKFELWDELVAAAQGPHLEATNKDTADVKRLRYLGVAYAETGNTELVTEVLADLDARLKKAQAAERKAAEQKKAADKRKKEAEEKKAAAKKKADEEKKAAEDKKAAEQKKTDELKKQGQEEPAAPDKVEGNDDSDAQKQAEAKKQAEEKQKAEAVKKAAAAKKPKPKPKPRPSAATVLRRNIEKAIAAIDGHRALAERDYAAALPLLKKAGEDAVPLARVQALSGDHDGAVKATETFMKSRPNRTRPLAAKVEILWLADKKDEAAAAFKMLQKSSSQVQLGAPVYDRLAPIAQELKLPADWTVAAEVAVDTGKRPELDELGPFRWQPMSAPAWSLEDHKNRSHTLKQFQGKPVVVIFYLGHGCLHCAEQLAAFAPMAEKFKQAGIEMIAISTDPIDDLKQSIENYKGTMPFPLVSDAKLDIFKAYRAFDDFEDVPLHGTFLIDGSGRVRWQDISYDPFMDPQFVLDESKRLLAQPGVTSVAVQSAK